MIILKKPEKIIFLVFIIAISIRTAIFLQDFSYLDRIFLPDDTYYTLSISRNIAGGFFPSADGVTLTSGFQPLIAFVVAPFFLLGFSDDQAALASIALSGIFGAFACGLFAKLIFTSVNSSLPAFLGGVIVATSPLIIRNDMNGLETSLSMFLCLCAILLYIEYIKTPTIHNACILGIIIGFMILARVDSTILAAFIGLMIVVRLNVRQVIMVGLIAALVVAPWWGYCIFHFGSPIPESGAAVRQLIEASGGDRMPMEMASNLAASILLDGIHISNVSYKESLIILSVLLSILIIFSRNDRALDGLLLLILCGIVVSLFYILYLPAFWFFPRYLHISIFAMIASVITAFWIVAQSLDKHGGTIFWGLGLLIILFNIHKDMIFFSEPDGSLYNGVAGAKGYREIAIDILSSIPSRSVIGAQQSGALGYYAGENIRVVNLDGVVDGGAYKAIKKRELSKFIIASNIDYIVGWNVNIRHMKMHSINSGGNLDIVEVKRFKKQGMDQFILYLVKQRQNNPVATMTSH